MKIMTFVRAAERHSEFLFLSITSREVCVCIFFSNREIIYFNLWWACAARGTSLSRSTCRTPASDLPNAISSLDESRPSAKSGSADTCDHKSLGTRGPRRYTVISYFNQAHARPPPSLSPYKHAFFHLLAVVKKVPAALLCTASYTLG